jgi:hypothetical protein
MTQTTDPKTPRPSSIKTAREKKGRSVGHTKHKVPHYSAVLCSLGREEVRERVLSRFRLEGGNRDRWQSSDHAIMAEAITRAEDWLELDHPRWPEREAIAAIRRKLEACCS